MLSVAPKTLDRSLKSLASHKQTLYLGMKKVAKYQMPQEYSLLDAGQRTFLEPYLNKICKLITSASSGVWRAGTEAGNKFARTSKTTKRTLLALSGAGIAYLLLTNKKFKK